MHVVYLHQHFKLPSESGGTRSWEFARRLVRDGHEVTVIRGTDGQWSKRRVDGVDIVSLPVLYENAMPIMQRAIAFLKFMMMSTRAALGVRSDLVFATSTPLTVAFPGVVSSILRRVPLIFEVRDLWPAVPIELGLLKNRFVISAAQTLERVAYWRASETVALSPSMAQGVLAVRPSARVVTIPNASDFEMFARTEAAQLDLKQQFGWHKGIHLVYAGSFGNSYDVPWLAELAVELCKFGVFVHIYGEGASRNAVNQILDRGGLEAKSVAPGAISKVDVAQRLAAADAVLSTLIDERCLEGNSLNKVFDAMAAGKPIFFNHAGWLRDAAVNANAGWQVSRDAVVAAEQIADIAQNGKLGLAGQRSAELGKKHFDRESLYSDFLAVLERASLRS